MAGLTGAGPRLVPEPGIEPGWTLWVRGILSSYQGSTPSVSIGALLQESSHLTSLPSPALARPDRWCRMVRAKQGQSTPR